MGARDVAGDCILRIAVAGTVGGEPFAHGAGERRFGGSILDHEIAPGLPVVRRGRRRGAQEHAFEHITPDSAPAR